MVRIYKESYSTISEFSHELFQLVLYLLFAVMVAEVTQPSLGVGYEIGRAVASKVPVIALFRPSSGKSKSKL